ncbi:hypothetical protein L0Y65_05105 [Candidatus Micrarchaeota archaeon]|nr:hypothetical protein [Candidatus Micrarchaeota archaeon]
MEQKAKSGGVKERWRDDEGACGRKAGLTTQIGCGFVLVPPGPGAASVARNGPGQAQRESIAAQIEKLKNGDVKTAVTASCALIKAGSRSVRQLADLLKDQHAPAFKRALFVLHNMDWMTIGKGRKEYAMEKLTPVLFTFTKDGVRSPTSLISQDIILRMGNDALPYITVLLRSRLPAARMIGLSALLEIYWPRMPFISVAAIESALDSMKDDPIGTFRQGARLVQKRIRAAYGLDRHEVSGQWAGEGAQDVRFVA